MVTRNTTIIHFSDLHLTATKLPQQQFIIKRLLNDIEYLADRGEEFHFVAFSGDIVNNADELNAYDLFIEHFLLPLSDATNVSLDRFVFCPGNHDISWIACRKHELALRQLFEHYDDDQMIESLSTNPELQIPLRAKTQQYN